MANTNEEKQEKFRRLRERIDNRIDIPSEGEDLERAEEIRKIVSLPGQLSFDEAFQGKIADEVERHLERPDASATSEAEAIVRRLEERPELRKALLPKLFRNSDTAVGEWHWAWHELERELAEIEERQRHRDPQVRLPQAS